MKLLFKIGVGLVLVGGAAVGWMFWSDLDPGEQHHLVDKAKRGDAEGFAETLQFKAGEAMDRQKQNAAEAAKKAASAVVDEASAQLKLAADRATAEANAQVKLAADQAAADAKAKIEAGGAADAGPEAGARATAGAGAN